MQRTKSYVQRWASDLYIKWAKEDPVSDLEAKRNNVLQNSVTIHVGARIGNNNEFFPGASINNNHQAAPDDDRTIWLWISQGLPLTVAVKPGSQGIARYR